MAAQNTNSMIKLALVFFVSLLSFSIGTYVGKKYSDNQHKLAALEPNKKSEAVAHENSEFASAHGEKETAAHDEKSSGSLTDNEVAKLAEEFAAEENETHSTGTAIPIAEVSTKEIQTIEPKATTTPKPAQQASTATTGSTYGLPQKTVATKSLTQQAAQQIEKSLQGAATSNERIPAAIPPEAKSGAAQFTLQVGSFPTPNEAQKLATDLQTKGYKSSFVPALVNGQTWYRVNVGLFGTSKEAIEYKKEFLDKTKMTSAIVQKVQN